MSRVIAVVYPPKRATCRRCGAPTTRLYTGRALSIELDRDTERLHRCVKKK